MSHNMTRLQRVIELRPNYLVLPTICRQKTTEPVPKDSITVSIRASPYLCLESRVARELQEAASGQVLQLPGEAGPGLSEAVAAVAGLGSVDQAAPGLESAEWERAAGAASDPVSELLAVWLALREYSVGLLEAVDPAAELALTDQAAPGLASEWDRAARAASDQASEPL